MLSARRAHDVAGLRDTMVAFLEAAMVDDVLDVPCARQGLTGEVYDGARVPAEDFSEAGRVLTDSAAGPCAHRGYTNGLKC